MMNELLKKNDKNLIKLSKDTVHMYYKKLKKKPVIN